jgi:hypothetical protein
MLIGDGATLIGGGGRNPDKMRRGRLRRPLSFPGKPHAHNKTVRNSGGRISIVDAKGGVSRVTIPDVNQSNGVIHVVNTVLMPG